MTSSPQSMFAPASSRRLPPRPGRPGARRMPTLRSERLNENPSRWYLTGFLAPADDPLALDGAEDDRGRSVGPGGDGDRRRGARCRRRGGAAGDNEAPEAPNAQAAIPAVLDRLDRPASARRQEIEAASPGATIAPSRRCLKMCLLPDEARRRTRTESRRSGVRRSIGFVTPKQRPCGSPSRRPRRPDCRSGKRGAAAAGRRTDAGNPLRVSSPTQHPNGSEQVRALTVFLVNRRAAVHRFYADVALRLPGAARARLRQGFRPRRDLSGYDADDPDLRVADLHYRDVCEWAVGRNAAAGWDARRGAAGTSRACGPIRCRWPKSSASRRTRTSTEIARGLRHGGACRARERRWRRARPSSCRPSGPICGVDRGASARSSTILPARRRETAERLIADMETARHAFRRHRHPSEQRDCANRVPVHESCGRHGARRRNAALRAIRPRNRHPNGGRSNSPSSCSISPALSDRKHTDREIADLLFFPTGGGKTEAYLGLAAFVIALRRLTGLACWVPGVAVIMRYTLRLLTLDQLARAAGVVCALELMRTDPKNVDEKGRRHARRLADRDRALGRLRCVAQPAGRQRRRRRDHRGRTRAPLPKLDGTSARPRRSRRARGAARRSRPQSFACVPNDHAPTNLEIRCANTACDFTREPAAADPDRRRADLSPPAGVPHRHRRQVREPALGRRDRRLLRSRRSISRGRRLLRSRPSRGRVAARQRLVARSARSHHPGRTAS